jgi:hypothetical protein
MPPSGLFHDQNRLGVGCDFDLTLHNDLNRRGRSTSMWSFKDDAMLTKKLDEKSDIMIALS